jgi:predicted ArsR family transcriptional regulator
MRPSLPQWRPSEWLHGIADPVRLDILRILSEEEWVTVAELVARCQASKATVRRHVEALVEFGLLRKQAGESDGLTGGRPAARFSLSSSARESVRDLLGPRPGLKLQAPESPPLII